MGNHPKSVNLQKGENIMSYCQESYESGYL